MGDSLERWPQWSESALQGLTFWIGHRNALYRSYPLGESALVAEASNLIFANLTHDEVLLCETQYTKLMPPDTWPDAFGRKARADLAILSGVSHREAKNLDSYRSHLSAVIEVKRAIASRAKIDQDLRRLAIFKHRNPMVRAFLFLVSESYRPRRFVSPKGGAIRGKHDIAGLNAHFRVRRACKATAAFSGKESAHYACIIEVYPGSHG